MNCAIMTSARHVGGAYCVRTGSEAGLPGTEKHVTVTVRQPDSHGTLLFQEKRVQIIFFLTTWCRL